jgi:16S rRNA (uracil1498-N3)-methyltransferase
MPELDLRSPRLSVDADLASGASVPLDRNHGDYLGNVMRLAAGGTVPDLNGGRVAGRDRGPQMAQSAGDPGWDRRASVAWPHRKPFSG